MTTAPLQRPDRLRDVGRRDRTSTFVLLVGFVVALGVLGALHDAPRAVVVPAQVAVAALTGWSALMGLAWFRGRSEQWIGRLASLMAPLITLTLAYLLLSERIAKAQVGGVRLSVLLLSSSTVIPWLGQAVCAPLYSVLSAGPRDVRTLRTQVRRLGPSLTVWTMPRVMCALCREIACFMIIGLTGSSITICSTNPC